MLHFAVGGVPLSTPSPGGTINGLKHAHSLGITAMEMEWVQRVPVNVDHMREIRSTADALGMYLTVHAPYYINLNAQNEKLAASKRRIIDALSMAEIAGAHSVCVHAAFYQGEDPTITNDRVRKATEEILSQKWKLFPHVNLAYETMGKPSQFGTLEEVLKMSREFGLYPTLDPAHLHARSNGKINSMIEFEQMFDLYVEYLGKDSLKQMHIHYSGIEYSAKGERKHLPLLESDARWKDFLTVLRKRKIGGSVVCESPILEEDTLLLQRQFEEK